MHVAACCFLLFYLFDNGRTRRLEQIVADANGNQYVTRCNQSNRDDVHEATINLECHETNATRTCAKRTAITKGSIKTTVHKDEICNGQFFANASWRKMSQAMTQQKELEERHWPREKPKVRI